ncbi:hypothetical protein EDB80DRAFT_811482 [Ilyonectria destructans]|nr:hypothetical protein EDB80DRAFT_811482 [Ilyonectria destructans]
MVNPTCFVTCTNVGISVTKHVTHPRTSGAATANRPGGNSAADQTRMYMEKISQSLDRTFSRTRFLALLPKGDWLDPSKSSNAKPEAGSMPHVGEYGLGGGVLSCNVSQYGIFTQSCNVIAQPRGFSRETRTCRNQTQKEASTRAPTFSAAHGEVPHYEAVLARRALGQRNPSRKKKKKRLRWGHVHGWNGPILASRILSKVR